MAKETEHDEKEVTSKSQDQDSKRRLKRLERMRNYSQNRRKTETLQERTKRLEKQRMYDRNKRLTETISDRFKRLQRMREYNSKIVKVGRRNKDQEDKQLLKTCTKANKNQVWIRVLNRNRSNSCEAAPSTWENSDGKYGL